MYKRQAYSNQTVRTAGPDPGIAAEINGGTHMPFEDMGIMRGIPGMVCVEPTDCAMLRSLMPQIVEHKGPVYIRLFRKKTEKVFEDGAAFDLFKAFTLRKGSDVTIIASGIMVSRALDAADLLKERGISAEVINVYTWKPIDEETIARSLAKTGAAVVAENHNVFNGLTSAVSEVAAKLCPVPVESVAVKDQFGEVGKMPYLSDRYGLNVGNIVDAAIKAANRRA